MFFISFEKLFSFSRYSNFCIFPFLSTLSRFKRRNGSEIIYDVMNWLNKFADVAFGITQKAALHYIIKLGQIIYKE